MLPLPRLARVASAAASAPASAFASAVAAPVRLAGQAAGTMVGALTMVGAPAAGRQVWFRPGRAHVEVYPEACSTDGVAQLTRRVADLDGVAWCSLDAPTRRLVVDFDPDRCSIDDLLATIDEVEAAGVEAGVGPGVEGKGHAAPVEHPADPRPLTTAALGLAASTAGLAAAALGQLTHLRAMPTSITAVVAMADSQPALRGVLEDRLGRATTDTVVAVANAVVQVLAQGTTSLAVDVAQRAGEVLELRARREVWERREPELYGPAPAAVHDSVDEPTDGHAERDGEPAMRRSMPDGPVERYARRVAAGGLAAAGLTLVTTRSPDRAGQALLVAAPRAARAARESFAAALTVGLGPYGVIPFTRDAFRRLDRIDTVVLDPGVLRGRRRLVLDAEPADESWSREEVWSAAQRLLWHEGPLPIPPPQGRPGTSLRLVPASRGTSTDELDLYEDDALVGRALVGWELDPLATAVFSAARSAGLRLVVAEDPNLGPLADAVDELLARGLPLEDAVRRLQGEGRVVVVVSGSDARALRAADLGITVLAPPGEPAPVPTADVLAGPSLDDVRRLLLAVPAARRASSAGVTLAASGAILGGLLLVASRPGTPGSRNMLPVHLASALAIGTGIVLGRGVAVLPAAAGTPHVPWHALEPDEVLARLAESASAGDDRWTGPSPPGPGADAARPLLPEGVRRLAGQLAAELADPLTPVLSVGAAASAILGSGTDALLVGSVLVGNAVISGVQRLRADTALRALLLQEELPARRLDARDPLAADADADVLRVRVSALRPGDLIELRTGDVVPADARLVLAENLEVDEASLTGEPGGVAKQMAATPGADLGDRSCMVHEGTVVVAGTGRAVVVAVGSDTAAGRAVALAGRAKAAGGLQVQLSDLTRRLLPVTLLGGGLVTGLALVRGAPIRGALASGVAVSVAAVPEGLPLLTTVAQLAAARRLSRRGVLVRSSRTVEALGRVDTVCFDKTGTLTQGRLRLVRVADLRGEHEPGDPGARRLLRAAAVSSPRGGAPVPHATDRAVLEAARAYLPAPRDQDWDDLAEVPFDSSRGWSAALGRRSRRTHLVVKGAPEVLVARCTRVALGEEVDPGTSPASEPLDAAGRQRARDLVEQLARDGLRVLAVAYRTLPADPLEPVENEVRDLTLLGFVALADTPRPEATDAVRRLRQAGISVRMITGDHPGTARAIATQVGLGPVTVITGRDLEGLDEEGRTRAVLGAQVFARTTPEQKVRIVEALHRAGRVVAMTGDGTNDAAAIRLADVGIGVGAAGSTAARRAGDLVLTRPDLGLVLDALGQGRAMWARAREAVAVLVGGNLGEVAFTVLGTAVAGRAPLGTRQFLLVNLLTDLFPAMAIALASDDRTVDLDAPVDSELALVRGVLIRGAVTAAAATAAWSIGRATGRARRASTIGLAALVGAQLGQTLLVAHRDSGVVVTAVGSALALAVVISVPGVSHFFGCTPLGPFGWGVVAVCAAGATALGVLVPRFAPAVPASLPQRSSTWIPSTTAAATETS